MSTFRKIIFISLVGFVLTACLSKQAPRRVKDWKRLPCGLYLSPNGELGFASDPEVANVDPSELEGERCPNVFITHFGVEDTLHLSSIIDTQSFAVLGDDFYKDKAHIYSYYAMCDGGYFNIFSADTSSFQRLGNGYISHQSKIFHFRRGFLDADYESFKVLPKYYALAKDKEGYFSFGERVTAEELKELLSEDLE